MIFHEFMYEFIYEFFPWTLLGTPEFIVFYEIMLDILDFGLFSWARSYQKSCLKNIVKNIVNPEDIKIESQALTDTAKA